MIPALDYLAVFTTHGDEETKAELLTAYTQSGYTLIATHIREKVVNGYKFLKDVMVFKKSDQIDPTAEKVSKLFEDLGIK